MLPTTTTPQDAGAALLQTVLATLRDRHGFEKSRVDTYSGPGEVQIRHHYAGGVFTLTAAQYDGRKIAVKDGKPLQNQTTWDARNGELPTVADVIYALFA